MFALRNPAEEIFEKVQIDWLSSSLIKSGLKAKIVILILSVHKGGDVTLPGAKVLQG